MTAATPSVRPAGSWICGGEGCHGSVAPAGAGHGSVSFDGGQKLTGDQTRRPRSTVCCTVK